MPSFLFYRFALQRLLGLLLPPTAQCRRLLFTNAFNSLQCSTAVLLSLEHLLTLHPGPLQPLTMPKRKRESSPPPPPHSSTRPRQPRRISPSQRTFCSESSFAQIEVERTEDGWNDIKAHAHERIRRYEVTKESEKLQDCFRGLLDWLPPGERDSIAHDILDAESDEMLLATYENIRTCLLQPSKSMQT